MNTDEKYGGMPTEYKDDSEYNVLSETPKGFVTDIIRTFWGNLSLNDKRYHDQVDVAMQDAEGKTSEQKELLDKSHEHNESRQNFILKLVALSAVYLILKA